MSSGQRSSSCPQPATRLAGCPRAGRPGYQGRSHLVSANDLKPRRARRSVRKKSSFVRRADLPAVSIGPYGPVRGGSRLLPGRRVPQDAPARTGRCAPRQVQGAGGSGRLSGSHREGAEGALRILWQFRERDCIVVSVKESWLNGSPEVQDLLVAFAERMAQQESRRRCERIRAGLARRRAEGTRGWCSATGTAGVPPEPGARHAPSALQVIGNIDAPSSPRSLGRSPRATPPPQAGSFAVRPIMPLAPASPTLPVHLPGASLASSISAAPGGFPSR